jgi:hypothetical protein
MCAKTTLMLKSSVRATPLIVAIIVSLIATDAALARGGQTNAGAPTVTATWSGTVRDHRGEHAIPPQPPQCVLYLGHWAGQGCRHNPPIVRDHRH